MKLLRSIGARVGTRASVLVLAALAAASPAQVLLNGAFTAKIDTAGTTLGRTDEVPTGLVSTATDPRVPGSPSVRYGGDNALFSALNLGNAVMLEGSQLNLYRADGTATAAFRGTLTGTRSSLGVVGITAAGNAYGSVTGSGQTIAARWTGTIATELSAFGGYSSSAVLGEFFNASKLFGVYSTAGGLDRVWSSSDGGTTFTTFAAPVPTLSYRFTGFGGALRNVANESDTASGSRIVVYNEDGSVRNVIAKTGFYLQAVGMSDSGDVYYNQVPLDGSSVRSFVAADNGSESELLLGGYQLQVRGVSRSGYYLGTAYDANGDGHVFIQGSPVPEPASLAALGIGALALLRRRSSRGASA